jgi:hypothetical protein
MNLKEQYDAISQFYDDALSVIASRQSDYAPTGVALLNVLDSCVTWNQQPFQVLGNLLDKQTTALQHLCIHGHVNSDPPVSRLKDAANYFAFFHIWLTRREEIMRSWMRYWETQPCKCHENFICKRCRTISWLNANAD